MYQTSYVCLLIGRVRYPTQKLRRRVYTATHYVELGVMPPAAASGVRAARGLSVCLVCVCRARATSRHAPTAARSYVAAGHSQSPTFVLNDPYKSRVSLVFAWGRICFWAGRYETCYWLEVFPVQAIFFSGKIWEACHSSLPGKWLSP